MESRSLAKVERKEWSIKIRKLKNQVQQFKNDCKIAHKQAISSQGPEISEIQLEQLSEQDQLFYGEKIQKIDIDILTECEREIVEATSIATNVLDQVQDQGIQLENQYDQLFEIEDELKRANAILQRMLRRIATDKCIWLLVGFLALFVALIFLRAIGVIPKLPN